MAIGSITREEAEGVWENIKNDSELNKLGEKNVLPPLLIKVIDFSTRIKDQEQSDAPLSLAVQNISIPIEDIKDSLYMCINEKRIQLVENDTPDFYRGIIEKVSSSQDTGCAFVSVPLIGNSGIIGVLVVDNRFLFSERTIDNDLLHCLEAYANAIAISIENTRLKLQLAEDEKLKIWRDSAANIVHTIGTRMSVINGSISQLRTFLNKNVDSNLFNETSVYFHEFYDGIQKADRVLKDFRVFAAPTELKLDEIDVTNEINKIIKEIKNNLQIDVVSTLMNEEIKILGDSTKLSDAFMELAINAQDARGSSKNDKLIISIITEVEELSFSSQQYYNIEFCDNGPGVAIEQKAFIFEPFNTTKKGSSGLGLAIVKQIILKHGGTIEEIGTPGEGAKFIIRIPINNK